MLSFANPQNARTLRLVAEKLGKSMNPPAVDMIDRELNGLILETEVERFIARQRHSDEPPINLIPFLGASHLKASASRPSALRRAALTTGIGRRCHDLPTTHKAPETLTIYDGPNDRHVVSLDR